jgi:hypothetical protein
MTAVAANKTSFQISSTRQPMSRLTLYILCSSSNFAIIHCPPLPISFTSSFDRAFLFGPGDLPFVSRGVPRLEGVVTSYGLFVLVLALEGEGLE